MADLLFIAITLAFFALAAGFVKLCDHIIGPDSEADLLAQGAVDDTVIGETGQSLEGASR